MMIALLTAATLWGCGKDNPGDDPPGPNSGTKGVYIAGWAASGDDEVAILWKDGQATKLTPTPLKKARALSVCVSGNDVYVGGYERRVAGSYETAVLWKNGVSTALSDNTYPCTPEFTPSRFQVMMFMPQECAIKQGENNCRIVEKRRGDRFECTRVFG